MNNNFHDAVTLLSTSFDNLFARKEFISRVVQRSLNSPSNWGEFAFTLALMALTFWLVHYLHQRNLERRATKPVPTETQKLMRLVMFRIAWPMLLLVSSFVLILIWQSVFGYKPIWPLLLFYAAPWMMMIRLVMAVLRSALPAKWFTGTLETAFSGLLWGMFILWLSGTGRILLQWMKDTEISFGKVEFSLFTVANAAFWIFIIILSTLWVARFLENRIMQVQGMNLSLRIVLSKILKAALLVLTILIALPLLGIDLTMLSVFGGALGVGIGFGLQKVASNYISGFIILLDRSISVGDRLTVNNFTGYVTSITSRFVVLKSTGGGEALVPNETFISNTVINESYSGTALWRSLTVQVAYQSDLAKAMQIMQEAAAKQERIQGTPTAFLTEFADNGVNLLLGFWVKDPENGFLGVDSAILLDIWHRFHEEGIDFPYPQREVRLINNAQAPEPSDEALRNAARASARQQNVKTPHETGGTAAPAVEAQDKT